MNLPAEELTPRELEFSDPGQPLLKCARIVKPKPWKAKKPTYREPEWIPKQSAMFSGGKKTGTSQGDTRGANPEGAFAL